MSKEWTRIVEDLQKYAEAERRNKSVFKRILNFFTSGCCGGDCRQGRSVCNCEKKHAKENKGCC